MYRIIFMVMVMFFFCLPAFAQQRIVAECTVTYTISTADSSADKSSTNSLKASVQTVYIKGNHSRVDIVSPSFTQAAVYDNESGGAFILREFGSNRFITKLSPEEWLVHNKKYDSLQLIRGTERKKILGYDCKNAVISLTDGATYEVFYATSIVPSVKEFEYPFKDVPGFVLEYTITDTKGRRIKYTAVKINLSPVQQAKFEIPISAGYRLLNDKIKD